MIVGLDFEDAVDQRRLPDIAGILTLLDRKEALRWSAFDDRGVVGIGHHRALRIGGMGRADHAEQRGVLRLAVEGPGGIEDLVAAVFGVGLREHHQLDIGRIATGCGKRLEQIIDFVGRQRQTHRGIGLVERSTTLGTDRNGLQRLARQVGKERRDVARVLSRRDHRFGHSVVKECCQRIALRSAELIAGRANAEQAGEQAAQTPAKRQRIGHTPLDADDLIEPAQAGDFGGLARPGADGSEARHDPQHRCARRFGGDRQAIVEQRGHPRARVGRQWLCRQHDMQPGGLDIGDSLVNRLQRLQQAASTEFGEGSAAPQYKCFGHLAKGLGGEPEV